MSLDIITSDTPLIEMMAFADFESASRTVLMYLQRRLGFGLWMMTRVEGDDWIILQAEDQSYGVKDGAVFQWADTFCKKMVDESGPRVAPNALDIPVYAAAAIGQQIPIGA